MFPDAMGMPRENRHFLLPYGNMVFNSIGPSNEFFEEAVANAAPVLAWLQRQMQRDAFAADGFGAAIQKNSQLFFEAPGWVRKAFGKPLRATAN